MKIVYHFFEQLIVVCFSSALKKGDKIHPIRDGRVLLAQFSPDFPNAHERSIFQFAHNFFRTLRQKGNQTGFRQPAKNLTDWRFLEAANQRFDFGESERRKRSGIRSETIHDFLLFFDGCVGNAKCGLPNGFVEETLLCRLKEEREFSKYNAKQFEFCVLQCDLNATIHKSMMKKQIIEHDLRIGYNRCRSLQHFF